jgi:hypothetical protein
MVDPVGAENSEPITIEPWQLVHLTNKFWPLVAWTPLGWNDLQLHFHVGEFTEDTINVAFYPTKGERRISLMMLAYVPASEIKQQVRDEFVALIEERADLSIIGGILDKPIPIVPSELTTFLAMRLAFQRSQ